MFYLVQAVENYTYSVLPSFTKLFNSKTLAKAYASQLMANKCGFDFAEITELEVESDPLSELTDEEYAKATCPF